MASKGVEVRVLRRAPKTVAGQLQYDMAVRYGEKDNSVLRKRVVAVSVLPQAADAVFQMQCAAIANTVRNPMVSGGSSSRPHHY